MVKTTYALTLFAAMSIAAPLQRNPLDMAATQPMRRDGSGNLLGAGSGGAMNDLVGQAYSQLEKQATDKLGEKTAQRTEGTQDAKKQNANILENVPVVGSLLAGSKRSASADEIVVRSLTSELSNLPVLGELLNKKKDKQNTKKPTGDGSATPAVSAPELKKMGQEAGQDAMESEADIFRRDLNSDLTNKINSLPIIGDIIGNKKQTAAAAAAKRDGNSKNSQYDPVYNLAEDITTKMEPTYNLADSASAAANVRRDLNSDLTQKINSLPIIGDLIGNKKKAPAGPVSKRGDETATSQYDPVYNLAEDVLQKTEPTFDLADAASAAAGAVRRDFLDLLKSPQELAKEKQQAASKASANAKSGTQQDKAHDEKSKDAAQAPAKDDKKDSKNPLRELFKESGLGALMGNSQHGVGLFPMTVRRDAPVAPRGDIEGATLPDVLLNGGVLGKVTKMLGPGGLQ